jgi:hypothetical protein
MLKAVAHAMDLILIALIIFRMLGIIAVFNLDTAFRRLYGALARYLGLFHIFIHLNVDLFVLKF